MNRKEMNKKLSQVIAKVWADEEYKEKLMNNPEAILRDEGIEIPAGMKVNVLENTDQEYNLVIPQKPEELTEELSDEDLDQVSGGVMTL